jgi:hypothetical protein
MKTVAIHQPNFMPWLGYFYKMAHADVFVLLDDVLHSKQSYTNRTNIKTSNGIKRLSIPLSKKEILIKDIPIATDGKWNKKHIKLIHDSYSKASFFQKYYPELKQLFLTEWDFLVDFNIATIQFIRKAFQIHTKLVRSSELLINEKDKNKRNLSICKAFNALIYLSGDGGGRQYNLEEIFGNEGLEVTYTNFSHPTYKQLWNGFEAGLSSIDLLFNHGPESNKILFGS